MLILRVIYRLLPFKDGKKIIPQLTLSEQDSFEGDQNIPKIIRMIETLNFRGLMQGLAK